MKEQSGQNTGRSSRLSRREMFGRTAGALAGLALTTSCAPFTAARSRPVKAIAPGGGFKIGGVDWELGKATDPSTLETAKRLGFDGLQVDLGKVEPMLQPEAQQQYRELAERHDIEIASLALGILNRVPYKSDPSAQEYVDQGIDIARAMGIRVLLLAFFGKGGLDNFDSGEVDVVVERLKEIAPKAEQAGVELGIEAHINVDQYMQILDRVGSPAVKVYFDTVHAHRNDRDVYQEITFLGDHICEFHAKDKGHIMFGQGDIDFRAVRRGMDAIGYRGWIHVEQWNEIRMDKPLGFDETHRRNLQYLREIFPYQV